MHTRTFYRPIALILFLMLLTQPPALRGQEQREEEDPRRMADDLKFQNGTQFYELRLYDKCLREMNEYLEIYVNGQHRREALWIVGSIYFDRFNYQKAIKSYQSLYREFPGEEDGIKGHYQTGICYLKMGYTKKARKVFNEIIEDHSESTYYSKAKTQLELIDISGGKSPEKSPSPEVKRVQPAPAAVPAEK